MVLDLYVYELRKILNISTKFASFWATVSNNVTIARMFNSFWLFTYPAFKNLKRAKNKVLSGGFVFFMFDICMWLQKK